METTCPEYFKASVADYLAMDKRSMGVRAVVLDALATWAETAEQKQIAEVLGLSPAYINDLLHERKAISNAFVRTAAKALNLAGDGKP